MRKQSKPIRISIEYKNDENAVNKLIQYVINFLLENHKYAGEINNAGKENGANNRSSDGTSKGGDLNV